MDSTNFKNISPVIRSMPPSHRIYKLIEPISYDVGHAMSGDRITVPAGFETDFASVPRAFWWLYPPSGQYSPAAIVHDYLYVNQCRSRLESDKIFLEAMKVLGVPWIRRSIIYSSVRAGGWLPWGKRSRLLK